MSLIGYVCVFLCFAVVCTARPCVWPILRPCSTKCRNRFETLAEIFSERPKLKVGYTAYVVIVLVVIVVVVDSVMNSLFHILVSKSLYVVVISSYNVHLVAHFSLLLK